MLRSSIGLILVWLWCAAAVAIACSSGRAYFKHRILDPEQRVLHAYHARLAREIAAVQAIPDGDL